MRCESCGTHGDWLGEDAQWKPISDGGSAAIVQVLECEDCGHRQHAR